ncbi:MAG: hypothetical protein RIB03_16065 [Henriciella sp.]|uniref:hypothetical protein n=1 Tax=Henriciella sp. TaxID=1968823 RepID=UPI0032EE65D4
MAKSWIQRLFQKRDYTHIGCIDFGTAYSKVSIVASEMSEDLMAQDIHGLAIGRDVSTNPFLLPSLLYVDEDTVRFGAHAETAARRGERRGRAPFMSPKQYLSTHALDELDDRLPVEIDPTEGYSARKLITLYLAFLLRRAEDAAREIKLDWPPRFRIARPAWDRERADWGETTLRTLVRHAFILVDRFGDDILSKEGLAHDAIHEAFDAIPDTSDFPDEEIFEISETGTATVPEATAVAAASLRPGERRVVVVADIGGGTSDFAAFVTGRPGHNVVAEIEGSACVLRQAGDFLDMQLRRLLVNKAGLLPDDPAARGAVAMIRARQRSLKETLFAEGRVVAEAGDQFVEMTLEEFLADEHVQAFAGRLRDTFKQSVDLAVDFARYLSQGSHTQVRVDILPTGGGHDLPMVREMIRKIGHDWRFSTIAPELLASNNDDFNAVSRQLAVSVGGAVLELPRQVGAVAA